MTRGALICGHSSSSRRDHRLQRIEHRPRRRPRIPRRLIRRRPTAPTVRRLIPNRRAISRCDTPSAAIARTCAHSNALRTSPPPPRSPHRRPRDPRHTGHHRPQVAHFSVPRSWRSIGLLASVLRRADGSPYGTRLPLFDRMRASRKAPRRLSLGTRCRRPRSGIGARHRSCFGGKAAVPPALSSPCTATRRPAADGRVGLKTRRTARHPWRAANTNLPARCPARVASRLPSP